MYSTSGSTKKKAMKSIRLNEDLIITIISKLPVKSIIQLKCVSKSLYKTIESPICVATHLDQSRSIKDDKHQNIAILNWNASTKQTFLSFISFDTFKLSSYINFQNPINDKKFFRPIHIIGSCDGLLCFLVDGTCYVANPATRKYKAIRAPTLPSRSPPCYGFGFDSKTNDYRLVRLTVQGRRTLRYKTEVLTLKNNPWRLSNSRVAKDVRMSKYCTSKAVLVNNALHWVGLKKRESPLIVAFDLANEVFRYIAIPNDAHDHHDDNDNHDPVFYCCSLFCGCLSVAAIISGTILDHERTIKVWVMKEYGVEESWMMQYQFSLAKNIRFSLSSTTMLEFGNNGEAIFTSGHSLIVFRSAPNSKKEDNKYYSTFVNIKPLQGGENNICIYRESLVPLD